MINSTAKSVYVTPGKDNRIRVGFPITQAMEEIAADGAKDAVRKLLSSIPQSELHGNELVVTVRIQQEGVAKDEGVEEMTPKVWP